MAINGIKGTSMAWKINFAHHWYNNGNIAITNKSTSIEITMISSVSQHKSIDARIVQERSGKCCFFSKNKLRQTKITSEKITQL